MMKMIYVMMKKKTKTINNQEEDFDLFVLINFDPFDRKQNVIDWIDITEEKFKQYKFNYHYRHKAVPLLVSHNAKRWYIRLRHNISSFDDFYELLLQEYDKSSMSTLIPRTHQTEKLEGKRKPPRSASLDRSTLRPATSNINETFKHHQPLYRSTTYFGGKEGVYKWLEDLESQFDTADIPDNNKFSIISYQLKGEALS
ncbi:unnamed protein product [Didymodactylos carnosus]|uniref:Uncharacterized protein n=1 Tax=Didymodactylos carnosus TaxID=1234261 RepID=A0A814F1T1_9BILA|nr:unnamed protein product [Didymodactylos carnosus]CAF0979027.1 unnamed protein product [Didymodactylos carnosus]CAF3698651.1 unnamed protein product [Didymodactylos carnosus]CAF3751760.1 unnamed protein product [Didymodactylos carnosus]